MSYRSKVYICFDADEDMQYYLTLKMWKSNSNIDFTFSDAHELITIRSDREETIKRSLRERLKNSRLMLVLVGEKTKNLYKYVRWEIEVALEMEIPIIAVNLNSKNRIDNNLCPSILKNKPIVHIPFTKDAVMYSINNWPTYYKTAVRKEQEDLYYKMFD